MTTGVAPALVKLEETPPAACDTTQKAGRVLLERFEFNNDYVQCLRNRDSAIWQHFYDFFRPRIRSKFRARFSWEVADDLTGATMLAVIESVDRGEPKDGACLAGYVFSTCHNKMLEAWRRGNHEKPVDCDFDSLRDNQRSPLQEITTKEEAEKIQRVLRRLSKKDRDILVCIHYYGQDRDEVCRKYGVKRDHLKMILFHARQRFQREWERD